MSKKQKKSADFRKIWEDILKSYKGIKDKQQKKILKAYLNEHLTDISTYVKSLGKDVPISEKSDAGIDTETSLREVKPSSNLITDLQNNHVLHPENETKNT